MSVFGASVLCQAEGLIKAGISSDSLGTSDLVVKKNRLDYYSKRRTPINPYYLNE